ncbi:hypothetical protein [Bacillus nitratireducens]|nr:hypothetical protein [Bacillus nitratireducens]
MKKQGIPRVKFQLLIKYRKENLKSIADCSFPLVVENVVQENPN